MTTSPDGPNPGGSQHASSGRAGDMTQAMQAMHAAPGGPKVLRIGLIQSGKIVEERIIRRRETVSVGTAEKNHFIIAAEGLASRFDLFQVVGDEYILNFTEDMSGRVGLAGGVHDLAELRASGAARNAGKYWQVKLTDASRGKVVIGNTTLLFQFVVAPPVTPRPQLPASARGGFVKSVDWLFTTFVALSFMLFFGFIIWLEEADWEIQQGVAQLPEGLARMIFQEPPVPEPETEVTEVTEEGETEVETPAERSSSRASSSSGGRSASNDSSSAESSADRSARLREEARAQAMALALGGLGGSDGGAFANALAGGAPTGDSADVIAQAQGVGVASGGTGGLQSRDGGGRGAGGGEGIGGLAQTGGGGMATEEGGAVTERVVGRMRISGGGDIGGSGQFDQSIVVSRIRGAQAAIKRCYERELSRNPELRGTVKVEFTIQTTGAVSGATATENTTNPAVGSCVVSVISRLRFSPGPTGGSVRYRFPFVFEPGG